MCAIIKFFQLIWYTRIRTLVIIIIRNNYWALCCHQNHHVNHHPFATTFSPLDHSNQPCTNFSQAIFNAGSTGWTKVIDGFAANISWLTKIQMAVTDVSYWITWWIGLLTCNHLGCWQKIVTINGFTIGNILQCILKYGLIQQSFHIGECLQCLLLFAWAV